jgi:PAS domain S-box-containing protein
MSIGKLSASSIVSGWQYQLGIALLYVLSGYVLNHNFISNNIVCTVWPGTGLALAALLIGGPRYIAGIILGSLTLNTVSNDSWWAIIGITSTHTVEALLGFRLLTRNGPFTLNPHTLRSYLRLILLGAAASIVAAVMGSLSILFAGYITPSDYFANVLRWWMGDTLGVVLVTPFILVWAQEKYKPINAMQLLEGLLLIGLSFLTGQIVFLDWFSQYFSDSPKGYWMFFFITCAALRIGNRCVTFLLLMVAIQALSGAYLRLGFFADDIAEAHLYNYWSYMLILSVVGMTFTAYVGELKQTLTALRASSGRTRMLLESALDGIISMDRSGNVIGWNRQAEHIFGYTREQALGRKVSELIVPPAYREAHLRGLERFMTTGVSGIIGTRMEVSALRADGSEFPMELAVDALGQKDGVFFSAYVRDISARKQADIALKESFDRLRKIASQLPGVVFQFRLYPDGRCSLPYASDVLRDIYRIDPEDVRIDAAKVFEVVHPDDLEQHLASIHDSARDLSPWRNEYRLRFADGTERWLYGNALPQREPDGSVLWHGFVTDITERRMIEEARRESENKLTTILDNVEAFIYIKDRNYRYQYANKAVRQILGRSLEDIIGKADSDFFDEATSAKLRENDRRTMEFGERTAAENSYTQKNSTVISTYFTVKQPLRREDGSIYGLCGISTDISERKQIENALRESEFRWKFAIEGSGDGLWDWDVANGTVFFSKRWKEMLGYGEDEIDCNLDEWEKRIHPDDKANVLSVIQDYFDGKVPVYTVEHRVRCKDDNWKWILDRGIIVSRDAEGKPLRMIGTHTDITERKQMEQKLRDSDAFSIGILNSLTSHIAVLDQNGVIIAVNEAWRQFGKENGLTGDMLGFNYLGVCGKPDSQLYGDEADAARTGIAAVLSGERDSFYLEYPCHSPTRQRWFRMSVSPLQGSYSGVVVSHENITERKLIEEKLLENENKLNIILDSVEAYIYIKDIHSRYQYANRFTRQLFGCELEEIIGKVDEEFFPIEMAAQLRENDRIVFESGEVLKTEEVDAVHRLTYLAIKQPLRREDGSIYGLCGISTDITERKKAELVAQAAAQYARSLIEASLDPLVTISPEGKITDVNRATEHVTGVSRDHLIGSDFADYFTDPEKAREGYRQVFSRDFVVDYPLAIRHVSGKVTDVLYNASVYYDADGKVQGIFAAARDITERLEREHQLGLFHSLFELTSDCVFMISPKQDFRFVFVNDATCQHFGVEREQLLQWRLPDWDARFRTQEDLDALWEEIKARKGFLIETIHSVASGRKVPVEVSANYLLYKGEEYAAGYFHDITERKLMEDELKASEAKFRSIIEVSPVPMGINDEQLNITFLNPVFVQTFGYSLEDIPTLADWWTKAYPEPGYRQWVVETWQQRLEQSGHGERSFQPLEVNVCCKDGGLKTVLVSAAVISESFRNEHLAVLYDITERKQAELVKRSSEQQLRAFYELDLVGLAITSVEKGWLRINDCLCKMLEYSEQELHRMTWAQLTHPDDLAADIEQFDKVVNNQIDGYALEKRFISRTGKIIPTKLVVRSVRKADGELDYITAMVEDISEYKQAEAELKRSNAELEQFAYAVSHDMRQPLRMVNSYLSLIESALAGQLDEETGRFLDFAKDGAKRMDAMILSLLDYSRVGRKTEAKTWIGSKVSLDEALAFLSPEIHSCGGEITVTGEWPELFVSRDELTRLLQNLIGNALKYHEENQVPRVHVHGAVYDGTLRVEVCDRGIGIEPSQMGRLFKVFSRLQARSRFDGTGVGLALCRKIVEHHGGSIGVESDGEGQGSTFWFELPIGNEPVPGPRSVQ